MVIFGNRTINAWNSLLDYIVTSPTVACFKHRLANLILRCSAAFFKFVVLIRILERLLLQFCTAFVSCRHIRHVHVHVHPTFSFITRDGKQCKIYMTANFITGDN